MSLTAPVSMSFVSPRAAQAEARELLSVLPGSPHNLKDVSYSDFAELSREAQDRLIELTELSGNSCGRRYLQCSIDLLVTIAHRRNDSALFDRFAPVLMPVAITQLRHLGDVYKRIRAIINTEENTAAVAIDAYFREVLEEHGFMIGTLVQYPGGTSYAVIDPSGYRYLPCRANPQLRGRHANLRKGDEVVFRVKGVTAHKIQGSRLYYVTMTNLSS